MESTGALAPWLFLALFVAASLLMIWRLEALSSGGMEGTVLGTLVMPYCSGAGNLIFAFIVAGRGRVPSHEVLTNSLVNNFTNLTLLIGFAAVIYGMSLLPEAGAKNKGRKGRSQKQEHQLNRLSLLLSLAAVLFFSGAAWALASDGKLQFADGLVLVGLFLFWQCFHVFDVLKSNVRQNRSFDWRLPMNLALLALGAWCIYVSTEWLVNWISKLDAGFVRAQNLGWISGWIMVLPNALLAFYYARRGNPEVVYTSQVGDGHICIPLCLGIAALHDTVKVPAFFETGILMLCAVTLVHGFCVAFLGRLPRWVAAGLCLAYLVFLYKGFGR